MGKEVSTGIKYKNQEVFHTLELKNPLSGFFTKSINGKKQKLVLADLNTNISSKLMATLKKNNITPPPGKILNPKTGRFVKEVEKDDKTFVDPISLNKTKKVDGIELNKQWYAKDGLRTWLNGGKNTIPHSRRKITDTEINQIFTNKNGTKVERKINNSNNNNNIIPNTLNNWRSNDNDNSNNNSNNNSNDNSNNNYEYNSNWGNREPVNRLNRPYRHGRLKNISDINALQDYLLKTPTRVRELPGIHMVWDDIKFSGLARLRPARYMMRSDPSPDINIEIKSNDVFNEENPQNLSYDIRIKAGNSNTRHYITATSTGNESPEVADKVIAFIRGRMSSGNWNNRRQNS